MGTQEIQKLADDIRDNGLREYITLSPDGTTIVDGRNRLRACGVAAVEPRFRRLPRNTTEESVLQHIISANLTTHKLTVGQRAMIGCAYIDELERIGITTGRGYGELREIAGDLVGVSGKTVQLAKKVIMNRPDLAESVRSGRRVLNTAYEETMESLGQRPKGHRAKPKPVMKLPAGNDKSRASTEARIRWLRYFATEEELDSFAIAKRLGIGDGVVRKIAKANDIEIPADAWVLKRRKGDFDINRVAQVVADDLMAMAPSIERLLDNPENLDQDKIDEWTEIFANSARNLSRVARLISNFKEDK